MSTRAPPAIPPRPTGSSLTPSTSNPDAPRIPPRPARRRNERPVSPEPDSFAPSPLNALPGEVASLNPERPPRLSSVTPPHPVGQKNKADEDIERQRGRKDENSYQIQQPAQTRNVNENLYLYAPRPSLPGSSAKAQVEVVTRTDSRQAAAAGLGKVTSPNNNEDDRARQMLSGDHGSQRELSRERHNSVQLNEEHGIPEIGQRVPMIPNAGDVQAPTPAHDAHSDREGPQPVQGHGHRDSSVPPGSYGLHGHGAQSNSQFEKAWYDKHPEEVSREEQGQLASPRPECAMSSDDLNKIVKSSAHRAAGLGTSTEAIGTPGEEIGYIATDELASRLASPPQGSGIREQGSQNLEKAAEQPMRTSSPTGTGAQEHEHAVKMTTSKQGSEEVKIHIDEPLHHQHHPDGFMPAPEEHKPHGDSLLDEADVLILAEDEVDERTEHLQPAVSPNLDKGGSSHVIESPEQKIHRKSTSASSDRQTAESVGNLSLSRNYSRAEELEDMRESVEDVEEYEPLFPNDDTNEKQSSAEERFKEPEQHQHRFPSQDIWEDAPDSLQLQTTVSLPEGSKGEVQSPEEEVANNQQAARRKSDSITKASSSQPDGASHRPDVKEQLPSRDTREEAPERQRLDTTVQVSEQLGEAKSPETDKEKPPAPGIPSRPQRKSPQISPPSQVPPSSVTKVEPTVSPTETKKPPAIPERPKPQIPPRPARPPKRTPEDSLTKVTSASSNDPAPPPVVKPKPPVPSRPLGSKIAALKAGFLSDLDNRLRLGPQAPKSEEKKDEDKPQAPKGPLKDARKGRARGPARRKPAVPSQAEDAAKLEPPPAFQMTLVEPWSVWSMSSDGVLTLAHEKRKDESSPKTESSLVVPEESLTPEKPMVDETAAAESLELKSKPSEVENQAPVEEPMVAESNDEPVSPAIPVSEPTATHSPPSLETESSKTSAELPTESTPEADLGNVTSDKIEVPKTVDVESTVPEAHRRESASNDIDVDLAHGSKAERTLSGASAEEC